MHWLESRWWSSDMLLTRRVNSRSLAQSVVSYAHRSTHRDRAYMILHFDSKACALTHSRARHHFNNTGKSLLVCLESAWECHTYVYIYIYYIYATCVYMGHKTGIKIDLHKNTEFWVMLCDCVPCLPLSTAEKVAVPVRPKRAATTAYCIPTPFMHSVSKGQSLTVAHSLFKATFSVPAKKSTPINVHRQHLNKTIRVCVLFTWV